MALSSCHESWTVRAPSDRDVVKPGFHPNTIACVGKQPIMVATASTEYPIGCCLQLIGCSVEAVATMIGCLPTHALAFGWKPGLSVCYLRAEVEQKYI